MSITVTVEQASASLKELLSQLQEGDEIIIEEQGKPLGRLTHAEIPLKQRVPNSAVGQGVIHPSFYEPMTDEELKDWGY